jgi:hypothetical protein
MRRTVIEERPTNLAAAVRVAPAVLENPAALVASAVSENLADPAVWAALENLAVLAELENRAVLAESENRAVLAALENRAVLAALENLAVLAESENLAVPVELVSLVELVVAVDQARCRRVGRAAAAVPIVSVATVHRGAEAEARSAAAAEITLAPVAAAVAIVWAEAVLAAVVEAAEAAVVVVVAAEDAVVVADAGDEQFRNGIKTYEIEIQHHEAIKNFFGRLCDRHVRFGGIFIAGCARN